MIIKTPNYTIRTIKTKTLKKLLDKRLAEVVVKLNIDPAFIDSDTTRNIFNKYKEAMDIIQKVESNGKQKIYLSTGTEPFLSEWLDLANPVNVLYWANVFQKERIFRRPFIHAQKRIPRYYLLLYEFNCSFSPVKDKECEIFLGVPNKIPKISINFLPVFKDGRVVFVRKDKLDQIKQVQVQNTFSWGIR
jgi:hypothetical protein